MLKGFDMSMRSEQLAASQAAFDQARKEGLSIFKAGRIATLAVEEWIAENKIRFPLDINQD